MIIGEKKLEKLSKSKVLVFGCGGVGSYAIESLARAGIGNLSICDKDVVDKTNINRQIIALNSTIGQNKADLMKKRLLDINPNINVESSICFYSKENSKDYDFSEYDYIVDAIDTISSKIEIIINADKSKTKLISCMGVGNKIDPKMLKISDIYKTSVCPMSRIIRYELRKRRIKKLKVLYSDEIPRKIQKDMVVRSSCGKVIPGSVSFVPSVAGIIIASEVVRDLINI